MNNKWLTLSEGLYLFGSSGINRIEPLALEYGFDKVKENDFKTVLYCSTGKVTVVKNTVDEIKKMLDND